jgi:RND family efflux transporter MFP subunit
MLIEVIALCLACTAYAGTQFEGIVKPVHEVELAFPIDGVVSKILVKEGTYVHKGDALVQLDESLQKLEVARRIEIFEDRSEIEANKKNIRIVKELLESARNLYRDFSAVSRDEVQNLEMQYHTLAGRIDVAEARKKQASIESEIAREMLRRYTLVSPIDGYVTLIKHEIGEWAKTGEPVVNAADTSRCYAEFNVDERYARTLKPDRQIPLRVREGDGFASKTGKIVYVAPVADKASALVRVKIEFDNKNGKSVPGVLAQIDFR